MLRILAITAPSTAASTSASGNTMNGALPPSSIDVRSRPSADCSTSLRPTSVEPVKVSLRSRGSSMIGFETSELELEVMTLSTPAGQPGLLEQPRQREHRERRLLGGLDDHRAAGRHGRADLARAHGGREVPRRDRVARADRLLHGDQAADAVRRRREAALDPHRLLGEPAQELGGVGDLGLGLGERLAHLRASSAAPGRRRARSSPRTPGAGSRRARAAGAAPTRPAPRPRRRAPPSRRRPWRRRPRPASPPSTDPRRPACRRPTRPATRRRCTAAWGPARRRRSPCPL